MSELKPCPFCGSEAKRFKEYGDERNGYADFVGYRCVGCHVSKGARGDTSKPGYADNSKIEERAIENWNRRTQPEATKPAQDLGAAILALPCTVPEELMGNQAAVFGYKRGFNSAMSGASQLAIAFAALASPVDALVADSAQPEANADAKDAGRWRFRQNLLLNGGCVLFSQRGVQFRDVHGVILCQGPTEEEAIDAAIQAQKDGHG